MDDNFYDEEDLVVASTSNRNWKGIIIAVIVIASILSLIVIAVIMLTPPDEGPRVKGRRFELEDVFGQQFQPYRSNGTWISDNEWIFRDMYGGASILNVYNGTTHSAIRNTTFLLCNAVSFSLSADKKYALLTHDVEKTHRFSFKAKYTIYDIKSDSAYPLTIEDERNKIGKPSVLQLVKWSPVGSSMVLVHENDIYFKLSANEKITHRLTDTAQSGTIYNGIPDWIYEEEILESNSALWFSNDGEHLLYLTFNDSLVGEHHILQYGNSPNQNDDFVYPKVKTLRYPKPGTSNPIVTISVCDLRKRDRFYHNQFRSPEDISNREHYITSAGWISATDVGIVWTSRSYHLSLISICSILSGSCQEEYRITTTERRGWVGNIPFPMFTTWTNSTNFITTAPIRDGENGFFDHLVLVDTMNKRSHPITHGSFDVIKINAWDENRKLVYFIATPANHPNERHLYSVKVDQPFTEHLADCISCTFSEQNITTMTKLNNNNIIYDDSQTLYSPNIHLGGMIRSSRKNANLTRSKQKEKDKDEAKEKESMEKINPPFSTLSVTSLLGRNSTCTFVTNVKFSLANNYFILECGGPNIPYEALYILADYPISDVRLIQILQPNDALVNLSRELAFPQIRIFPVHLHSGAYAHVRLLLPPGLREDEIIQYPLILNVYGAPGSQLAVDRWEVDFATYLASKKDYIIAQIDGRGSGGRGWDYKHQVYYNLGYLETHDQIEVVRHLRDSLPYVETNKIGIWGWSYGGYLTASIMTSRDTTDLFQCGASIAPITKWNLMDSTYSEKYMGTPNVTDNYKGYAHSDLTRNIESLSKKAFYLIHGTADDNVHIQHSMLLAKALIDKKILFRQQIYPDEPHTLSGAKIHVHRSLEEFFDDCFKKQITPEVETGLNKGGKFDDFD